MASNLVDKRNELKAKQEKLAAILLESKNDAGEYDFTKCKALDGETSEQKVESFQALHEELATLASEVAKGRIDEIAMEVKAIGERNTRPVRGPSLPDNFQAKSIGQLVGESEDYKAFVKSKGEQKGFSVSLTEMESKALFETGAGWAPESVRSGRIAEFPTRPVQILDFIPSIPIEQPQVVYMEETLRTHGAAERAEGGTFAEDAYELVERTSQVRYIGSSLPVTDEQLEDVGQVAGYIDGRLRFGVRQRADRQVILGDGVSPNLRGILAVVGIQTQAKGTDPTFDAIHKAITKVSVTGRAMPNVIVQHPNDWEAVRLTRTADGIYIMGNPADPGPRTLFGLPVVVADVITENTSLVGDFLNHSAFHPRRGILVETGYVNAQFTEGKRTLRAGMRAAFVVYRPSAFCTVTGV